MADANSESEKRRILFRAIVEFIGAPEEHLKKTIDLVINKLKQDYKNLKVVNELKAKIEPYDQKFYGKKLFSTFVELEISAKTLEDVIGFCFDFLPSSVELIEPSNMTFNSFEFSGLINDMLTKLHQFNMFVKNIGAENQLLKQQLNKLKQNEEQDSEKDSN